MPKQQETDLNLEIRKRQLENLKQFIASSLEKTNSIINFMGWDLSKVVEDDGLVQCSIQPSHHMPKPSLQKHVAKCVYRHEGYNSSEQFLSEPSSNTESLLYICDDTKRSLFLQAQRSTPGFKSGWSSRCPDPRTADRLISTYTEDERLALYDYTVANTKAHPAPPEFDVYTPKAEKQLTYEERLMQERDAKRRRTKYKAVHTNKKSYTEVMREVIDSQMKLYEEWCSANGESGSSDPKHKNFDESHSEDARHADFGRGSYRSSSKKTHHKSDSHQRHHTHHK